MADKKAELHPFWDGFLGELRKEAIVDPAVAAEYAAEHPVVAATAVGVPLGLAAIGVKRAIQRRLAPAPAPAKGGFGLKGLAAAAGVGAVGGYLAGKKKE